MSEEKHHHHYHHQYHPFHLLHMVHGDQVIQSTGGYSATGEMKIDNKFERSEKVRKENHKPSEELGVLESIATGAFRLIRPLAAAFAPVGAFAIVRSVGAVGALLRSLAGQFGYFGHFFAEKKKPERPHRDGIEEEVAPPAAVGAAAVGAGGYVFPEHQGKEESKEKAKGLEGKKHADL